jgi:hypothetical protein
MRLRVGARQLAFIQSTREAEIAFKCSRAIGDQAKQVWSDTELLLNGLEQRLGS